MPVRFQPAEPVGAVGSIYEQNYALQLQRQNAEMQQNAMMAAAARGGGGGGGGGGSNIQDAINSRDRMQMQWEQNAQAAMGVPQSQVYAQQAAARHQQDQFANEAQLSQMQLTQQESMRLARMKNAIGDVQADPTLSDQEKADMTLQLKTGIDPLARRDAAAKVQAQQQMNEQHAQLYKFQAAAEKMKMDAIGKSAEDRQSFVPDPKHLAAIVADLDATVPELPDMMGGKEARSKMIEQLARQEAVRQGLGTTWQMEPDGKHHAVSGPGSKEHEMLLKAEAEGSRGQWTDEKFFKAREHAERTVDTRAKEMKEGRYPGTKELAHPHLQDLEERRKEVEKHLKSMGAPTTYDELHAMQKKGASAYSYDKSKAPWNRGKAETVAAAASPRAGSQKPFNYYDEKSQSPEQKADVGNLKGLWGKASAASESEESRLAAARAHETARTLLEKSGSFEDMKDHEKQEYMRAIETLVKASKGEPLGRAGTPGTPGPLAARTMRTLVGANPALGRQLTPAWGQ